MIPSSSVHPAVAPLTALPDLVSVKTAEAGSLKSICIEYPATPKADGAPWPSVVIGIGLETGSRRLAPFGNGGPSDLVRNVAFGCRPTRPSAFVFRHAQALVHQAGGTLPAEWRLEEVSRAVVAEIEDKITEAFDGHFLHHLPRTLSIGVQI
jgi:hypothetical protein